MAGGTRRLQRPCARASSGALDGAAVRPSEGGRVILSGVELRHGAGVERFKLLEEYASKNHPPLAGGRGDRAIGGGHLLAGPAAVKTDVGFHARPSPGEAQSHSRVVEGEFNVSYPQVESG